MATGWIWSERYLWHDSRGPADYLPHDAYFEPEPSPESPVSKRRFRSLVEVSGMSEHLVHLPPRPATTDELGRIHSADYIERVRSMSAHHGGDAGDEALFGRGGYDIAVLAAGGAITAVEAVLDGVVDNAYALVRPPGHHAGRDRGRGYCIFGNTAIAAAHARAARGVARVAIVDWDVHHGNGTESAFIDDASVLTISVHQDRRYPPDTGSVGDVGEGPGRGRNLNVPLPPGGGRASYEYAFAKVVLPALDAFRPDLILVASGLDGNAHDPSARMNLTPECFGRLAALMVEAAARLCEGRLVLVHEGGYSTSLVPYCGLAILEELSGHRTDVPLARGSDPVPIGMPLREHERAAIDAAAANLALLS